MPKAKPARAAFIALLVLAAFAVTFNVVSAVTGSDAGVHVSLVLTTLLVGGGGLIAAWKARERREAEREAKKNASSTSG